MFGDCGIIPQTRCRFQQCSYAIFMSVTTKLLLLLTSIVGLVMFGASLLMLRQYELALQNTLREDLKAHAVTLQIALEEDYARGSFSEAQRLIDRLRENSEIYVAILFDREQNVVAESKAVKEENLRRPKDLPDVLQTGKSIENITEIDGEKYVSVLQPLRSSNEILGAFEILKPISLIKDDIYYARVYWVLTMLSILAVIIAVVHLVLQRNLSVPIKELLSATQAVGEGDFSHQVTVKSKRDEFSILANQFNQMAVSLFEQQENSKAELENRLRLEREIRHNEQLVMVGRMAAGVAHELGAPLNVIDARAEQLQKREDIDSDKKKRNLEIIRSNVARITHLVKLLLNLARPFNFDLQKVSLEESLKISLEQIESAAEFSHVKVSFESKEDLTVNADPNYLQQVWLNILLNAVQEMPNGGNLTVELRKDVKGFALVDIADTGKGILPEHFISLFDPFFTTKDIGKGTGLGLPIANRIVEEHGGTISAQNNLKGGAKFTVKLPLSETENNGK